MASRHAAPALKKRIPADRKFLLKWESQESNKLLELTEEEKDGLADKLSFAQIDDLAPKAFHDENARRKRKWREIRQLWTVLSLREYSFQTVENAFWKQTYGVYHITCEFFVSSMLSNFRFDHSLALDKHLRWLYWSFEGGSENKADWRDIFACVKILLLARLLRHDIVDLLVNLFDLYSTGGTSSRSLPDEEWYIVDPPEQLKKVHFSFPSPTRLTRHSLTSPLLCGRCFCCRARATTTCPSWPTCSTWP